MPTTAAIVNLTFRFHDFGGSAPHAAKLYFKNGDDAAITNNSNGLTEIEPFMIQNLDVNLLNAEGNVSSNISSIVVAARAAGINKICIALALANEGLPGTSHDIVSIETIAGNAIIVFGSYTIFTGP